MVGCQPLPGRALLRLRFRVGCRPAPGSAGNANVAADRSGESIPGSVAGGCCCACGRGWRRRRSGGRPAGHGCPGGSSGPCRGWNGQRRTDDAASWLDGAASGRCASTGGADHAGGNDWWRQQRAVLSGTAVERGRRRDSDPGERGGCGADGSCARAPGVGGRGGRQGVGMEASACCSSGRVSH